MTGRHVAVWWSITAGRVHTDWWRAVTLLCDDPLLQAEFTLTDDGSSRCCVMIHYCRQSSHWLMTGRHVAVWWSITASRVHTLLISSLSVLLHCYQYKQHLLPVWDSPSVSVLSLRELELGLTCDMNRKYSQKLLQTTALLDLCSFDFHVLMFIHLSVHVTCLQMYLFCERFLPLRNLS